MKYVDVHCHPNLKGLREDQDAVIGAMREEGIAGIVVGVDLTSSREAVALAEKYDNLWATIGLHPNHAFDEEFDEAAFEELISHPKVVAVGECGLDYYRLPAEEVEGGRLQVEDLKKKQWELLEKQVAFALAHNKPLMVHCRPSKNSMDAYRDFLGFIEPIIKKNKDVGRPYLRGNMHFFVGNLEVAKRFWDLGFTTSFTGVLTFTHEYDAVVKAAPLDMILTETDAPYAAPVPYRGQVNQPVYVRHVAEAVARIRSEKEEDVAKTVRANAERLFGIALENPKF